MQANLPLGSMRTLGSCGYNMVQACCYRPEIYANATEFVWEGGYISGTSLLIEERSTVMCKYNSTGSALCGCGVSTQKFDLDKSTCISWCESGKVGFLRQIQSSVILIFQCQGVVNHVNVELIPRQVSIGYRHVSRVQWVHIPENWVHRSVWNVKKILMLKN